MDDFYMDLTDYEINFIVPNDYYLNSDIIQKVEYEIALAGVDNTLNGGIVLTGGGSSLKEVKQLFSFQTGFDVHIGTPGQHLGRGQVDEVRKPLYATAIGLVMKGIEINATIINKFD